jgi:hypothetical protein
VSSAKPETPTQPVPPDKQETSAMPVSSAKTAAPAKPAKSKQPETPPQSLAVIGAIDDNSLQRLEDATVALTSGIDALRHSMFQSNRDIDARNQALLKGIENAFDRFAGKISSDISASLDSNSTLTAKMLGDSLLQSSNDTQLRNQALLSGIEGIFSRFSVNISSGISAAMDSNNSLAADLALSVKRFDAITLEQSNKTSELITNLMSGIANQISLSMSDTVLAISESIHNANSANAALIDQLTERTDKLVAEYEHYFSTIERTTTAIMSDMNSMVSNTIMGLSEQMTGAMGSFNESMSSALEWFETGAEKMIGQFDEQSRDIGLYAREINQDISALSTNLKESVTIFNKGLNESVKYTFREIDEGISDLSMRFANTLEAIQDTVDAMPTR